MSKQAKKEATYYDIPPNKQIAALLDGNAELKAELAQKLNVTVEAIRLWTTGYARPDISKLRDIARFFNVTTDFLLGETESKSTDRDVVAIGNELGLSDYSITALKKINGAGGAFQKAIDTINILLEQVAREGNMLHGGFSLMSGEGHLGIDNTGVANCFLYVMSQFFDYEFNEKDCYRVCKFTEVKRESNKEGGETIHYSTDKVNEQGKVMYEILPSSVMKEVFLTSVARAAAEVKEQIGSTNRHYQWPKRL